MNENILDLPALQWYPGHMKRAKDIITENLSLVDVVVELLDARAPISSANPMLAEILKGKQRVVVLNKADLADEKITREFIADFKAQNIKAVAIDAKEGRGVKETVKAIEFLAKPYTEKWAKAGAKKRAARCMILGIPNVGKSTLINRLAGSAKTKTADKLGVTRNKQWIKIGADLELLDTPGILWPKFDDTQVGLNLAFIGAISDDVMDIEKIAALLAEKIRDDNKEAMRDRFKIEDSELTGEEIIEVIGKKRGCLVKGGIVDTEKAARILINEYRNGKLGRITLENV